MKKLSEIKLHDAVVLENREMKAIYGGSGGASDSVVHTVQVRLVVASHVYRTEVQLKLNLWRDQMVGGAVIQQSSNRFVVVNKYSLF